jgi:hypothetical protein
MMMSSRRNLNKGPRIVAHDHDVLCGRGVNIAQHTGNERFRSLVNTRHDESYCENFSTSEKKALALEIIEHIQSLQPPGRFLKRSGRQHSSRGLEGPWEELTSKERIKKTCQALRDCNRNDRTGYGVSVTIPEDVKQQADELSKSGLSLKEYAANKVAKTHNEKTPLKKKPPSTAETHAAAKSVVAKTTSHSKTPSKKPPPLTEKGSWKRYATPTTGEDNGTNPTALSAATSHKRQRTEELEMIYSSHNIHPQNIMSNSSSLSSSSSFAASASAVQLQGSVLSASAATTTAAMYASTLDANTPTHSLSYTAAVPVTNTPGPLNNHSFLHQPQHQHHQQMPDVDLMHSHGNYNHTTGGPPSQPPVMPPSPMNHQDLQLMAACANSVADAAILAYSPVVWNHHGCEGRPLTATEEEDDIEPVPIRDLKPSYQQDLFGDPLAPHLAHHDDDDATEPEDVFRSVAANASANLGDNGEGNFPPIMMPQDGGGLEHWI